MARLELQIVKHRYELSLYVDSRVEAVYPVTLGRNAHRDKRVEGDEATPLGSFYVCAKNPRSKFFRSLCLSYPNAAHAARGLAEGVIDAAEYGKILAALEAGKMPPQHTPLGGEIYIHGAALDASGRGTRGCIALDNDVMGMLFERVELGTPVLIRA